MMEDDQQFCLRWNNHQSTLISVFDTLLENEKLVDCTLAAEGRIMKAHKVVLSACSPYFATLLQEQYDKHPIFILKDVKYQELRAMMDYMYRGEVNISQDQLAALLKAAESLQIKGLSDNRTGAPAPRAEQQPQQQPQQHHRGLNVPGGSKLGGGYTLEAQTKRARVGAGPLDSQDISGSREGSSSPSRRRRKVRRKSIENAMAEPHDSSNSSQQQQASLLQSNAALAGVSAITAAASALASQLPTVSGVATTGAAIGGSTQAIASAQQPQQQQQLQQQQQQGQLTTTTSVTKKTENVKGTSDAINTENVQVAAVAGGNVAAGIIDSETLEQHVKSDKQNHKQKQSGGGVGVGVGVGVSSGGGGKEGSELVIEPKSEYDEEGNDETCEDLTLDDEDMGMDDLDQNAGTSQGGEGSSQGYAAWQHDRSQDEILLSTQEAQQQRDPQDRKPCIHPSSNINGGVEDMKYEFKPSMIIGNENSLNQRFPCVVCGKSYLRKRHLQRHMRDECIGIPPRFSCELCPSRFRRKYHMVRHLTSKHGIPTAIAQQTTGNSTRNGGGSGGGGGGGGGSGVNVLGISSVGNNGNTSGCENGSVGSNGSHHGGDSPIPENLSIRKFDYKNEISLSPCNVVAAASGGGCGGGGGGVGAGNYGCGGNIGVMRSSPVPGTAAVGGANGGTNTLPTYGLTGAITAISAAAAVIEEQAAQAAAAAAAASQQMLTMHGNNIINANDAAAAAAAAASATDSEVAAAAHVKKEPITPSKAANMLDEDWKMKLSLQFISNSLLKERLMNTMPFAYNNN